jgi:Arrestin (or S-antigen), C-terminal domain
MSGYASGQKIHISGELINKSNVHVHSIHFKLSKTITFYADKPSHRTKMETLKVAEVQATGVAAGTTAKINQSLVIPAIAPTNLTQSKVIHQAYELIVEAEVSGCHKNPRIHIPVLIGTVPLRQLPESPLATAPGSESQPFLFPTPAAPPLDNNSQENTNFLELRMFS